MSSVPLLKLNVASLEWWFFQNISITLFKMQYSFQVLTGLELGTKAKA